MHTNTKWENKSKIARTAYSCTPVLGGGAARLAVSCWLSWFSRHRTFVAAAAAFGDL